VHVVTIEDPIEVLHFDKMSMINQREVRVDTEDFVTAMRAAMRQDPDVILVGEMRDHETVKAGLAAAETGHFVMSTLHTTDAAETINRSSTSSRRTSRSRSGWRWPARCAGSSASGWCPGPTVRAAAWSWRSP
jgi:Tfp pilus assembly pilus retraction ATPase PilT